MSVVTVAVSSCSECKSRVGWDRICSEDIVARSSRLQCTSSQGNVNRATVVL